MSGTDLATRASAREAIMLYAEAHASDEAMAGVLERDYGMTRAEAQDWMREHMREILAHRFAARGDLAVHVNRLATEPGFAKAAGLTKEAVSLLRSLAFQHLGWTSGGMDQETRKLTETAERRASNKRAMRAV